MRVSEGVPREKICTINNPKLVNEYEEVIVFSRDEFNRTFAYMVE